MATSDALDELVNLRDLGGQPTGDGVLTRSGVVYRSDAPHPGDRDPAGASAWPPRVVVDLREAVETQDEHPLAPVAQVHRVRVLEGLDKPETDGSVHELTLLYQGMLEGAPKKLVEVFRQVLEADGPALVHCAAGKDRTGVVIAMALSVTGVPREEIVADYEATGERIEQILDRLRSSPTYAKDIDNVPAHEHDPRPDIMRRFLARLDGDFGGPLGWLREHGFEKVDAGRLRDKLVEE